MTKSLIIFLTHDFKPVFLETLKRNDKYYKHLEIIVLFDNTKNYDDKLNDIKNKYKKEEPQKLEEETIEINISSSEN